MPTPVYAGANVSVGNGVTLAFPYNFKVLDQAHIEVKIDGVLKVLGADYTVTGVGLSAGGNVNFLAAPAVGAIVQRARKVPIKRDQDYQNNGDFKEVTVDNDFDLIEMQVQQIAADVARAFKAPLSVTTDQVVADADWAAAAGKFLRRKNDGSGIEFVAASPDDNTFTASGLGAVARSWSSKVGEIVSAKDFGATGDGVTNDKAAIIAAFAASPHVFFPAGTYNLGDLAGGASAIALNGAGGKLSILTNGGQVKFLCNTIDNTATTCFLIQNAVGVRIGDLAFEDTGYNGAITFRGAIGLNISGGGGIVNDVRISSLYAKNMIAPVQAGYYAQARVTGVKIDLIVTDTCTYGFNAQNNGDGVEIGMIFATNTKRSYFVYGVKQHRVNIYHVDGAAMAVTTGNVLLARYVAGYDTEDIDIRFKGNNINNNTGPIVNFTHFGTAAGYIRNVTLDVDIDSATAIHIVQAINYTDDTGAAENVGASDRVIDRVFLKGRIDAAGAPDYVHIRYQPNTKGMLVLDESFPKAKLSAAALAYFTQGDPWVTYAPVWASAGVQPAIGNGTLSGTYHRQGQTVDTTVAIAMGGTTTYGTLEYTFSLPFTSANDGIGAVGSVYALRAGVAYRIGSCFVPSNSNLVSVLFDNGVTAMSAAVPHAWANGDFMKFSIRYRT